MWLPRNTAKVNVCLFCVPLSTGNTTRSMAPFHCCKNTRAVQSLTGSAENSVKPDDNVMVLYRSRLLITLFMKSICLMICNSKIEVTRDSTLSVRNQQPIFFRKEEKKNPVCAELHLMKGLGRETPTGLHWKYAFFFFLLSAVAKLLSDADLRMNW